MTLFGKLSNLFSKKNLSLSEKLEKLNYFDLMVDPIKIEKLKFEIDKKAEPGTHYNGNIWLTFPNDSYISSVYNLKENVDSSTSDFRAFEVWAEDLYEQNLESYLKSAKQVFEKNGLKLNWTNENIDYERGDILSHTISINDFNYTLYSEETRNRNNPPELEYLINFRKIMNEVINKQASKLKLVLVSAPECVHFVLCNDEILNGLKSIIDETDNIIEE